MRILVLFFTLFFTFTNWVFGASIELSLDATQVQVWESFDLIIDVYPDDWEQVNIETILWIEDFTLLGQSSSQRYVSINGETQSQNQLYLTLIAENQWDFTIWPASATGSWSMIQSNAVEIKVWNDTIASPADSWWDILDIFEASDRKLTFNYLPFLIAWFFIIFFILIKKLMNKPEPETIPTPESEISENDRLISQLKSLKRKSSKVEKTDFYSEFNSIMREFFTLLWYKNTEKKTLREISKLWIENKNILSIFKESYTKEFDYKKDTLEQRKKMIDDFIQELKK